MCTGQGVKGGREGLGEEIFTAVFMRRIKKLKNYLRLCLCLCLCMDAYSVYSISID